MASKAIKFLEEHQSETPSRFTEEADWRKENAGWLRWSRQLAVTLIGYMQDNGLKGSFPVMEILRLHEQRF